MSSRWDLIRRRVIGPVMFVGGIALLARETCRNERTHATIVLELGEAASRVRSIEVDLMVEGELISTFRRNALDGMAIGAVQFEATMPDKDGELRIDVELDSARRKLSRRIHAEDGSIVTVPLAAELR